MLRDGEDDMKVAGRQQFLLARGQPALSCLSLTLRTVPVAAGVIGDASLVAALSTDIDMSSEGRCPAAGDGAHHLELLEAEPPSIPIEEPAELGAEDVGHLHGRPAHGFFSLRERLLLVGLDSDNPSMGLATARRCRCERCR